MSAEISETDAIQREWLEAATWTVPLVTFLAALLLMVHHTYLLPLREPLSVMRWLPFSALVGYVGLVARLNPSRLRRVYWFDLSVMAFIGLAVASTSYSIAPAITGPRALSLAFVYVALFWGLWVAVDRIGTRAVITSFVYAGTVLFVLLYLTLPLLNFQLATTGNRLRSFLENANTVGLLVAFLLPLVLFKAVESGRRVWSTVVGLLLVSLILSQSRTGLGATLLSSGYFLYHAFPDKRRRVALCAGVYLLLNALWFLQAFGPVSSALSVLTDAPLYAEERVPLRSLELRQATLVAEIEQSTGEVRTHWSGDDSSFLSRLSNWRQNPRIQDLTSLGFRLPVWLAGLEYLMSRPLLGYGYGTEEFVMRLHGFNIQAYGDRVHNSFLGMAIQVGLLGATLFYAPLFALVWVEFRSRCTYVDAPERFALRAVLIVGLVIACFESSLYAVGNIFAFWFWTAVMMLGRIAVKESTGSDHPPLRDRCEIIESRGV